MTPKQLALRLAALTLLEDKIKTERETTREQVMTALDELGGDQVRAELPDGTRIAKVSIAAPKPSARVTDEQALTGWVAESMPTEVLMRIRDSYKKVLLDRLVPAEDGSAVDPDTGEIVPGVHFTERNRYPSIRFEPEGKTALEAAFRAGTVGLDLTGDTFALEA